MGFASVRSGLFAGAVALGASAAPVHPCSCYWAGPFTDVAPRSESVIRAVVRSYADTSGAIPLAMDLDVREVLMGDAGGPAIRIWGDNGALCRPYVTRFPPGTEWILALNGPGSKPGMSPGPSISVCGEYWLEVQEGLVVGNVNDPKQGASQRMSLEKLRALFAGALGEGGIRGHASFRGEVNAGETFERPFGSRFSFRLEPMAAGWTIAVREAGRDEDLSRLTPPLHGVPNPRDIEGWHFRNADDSGPNEPGDRNVNAPGERREFIFSPAVGLTIDGPGAGRSVSPADVDSVGAFGRGTLTILDARLGHIRSGERAAIERMRFEVDLLWGRPTAK